MSGQPWIRLNCAAPDHPRIRDLTPDAAWLWIRLLCYSGAYLTDGHVPASWPKRPLRELERAGLIVQDGHADGYWLRDWLDYQRSAEDVHAEAKRRRERGRIQPRNEDGRFRRADGSYGPEDGP